jgi:hypothetical protein
MPNEPTPAARLRQLRDQVIRYVYGERYRASPRWRSGEASQGKGDEGKAVER